jgi:RNA polymerase sigma factor (sigma-70 family)
VNQDRRAAFELLWQTEYLRIVRAAYLITGDREEALDVSQEAFARAYERWRTVSRLDRPGAWVQRVAVNLAISWRRRQRIRTRKPVATGSESTVALPEPLEAEVLAALRSLSPSQRSAVVLRYYADWSIEDVARCLRKRPGTVRALSAQGLARLRATLVHEEMVNGP